MTTLTAYRAEHLARRVQFGLTVAIILGVVEILRRSPTWLLIAAGLLLYLAVLVVILYVWWIVGALAVVVGWKVARGFARGWREVR